MVHDNGAPCTISQVSRSNLDQSHLCCLSFLGSCQGNMPPINAQGPKFAREESVDKGSCVADTMNPFNLIIAKVPCVALAISKGLCVQ
jgi:hypothetical protein